MDGNFDKNVENILSCLSESQREILIQALDTQTRSNDYQQATTSRAKPVPVSGKVWPYPPKRKIFETKPQSPRVSRGKDIKMLRECCEPPTKIKRKNEAGADIRKFLKPKTKIVENKPANAEMDQKKKVTHYDEVKESMRAQLKTDALKAQSKQSVAQDGKSNIEESDEEFQQWIMKQKTGLDAGLVPRKVISIFEFKGVLMHTVQWEEAGVKCEAIPSKILSAKYPQVVIKFYESHAVAVNLKNYFQKPNSDKVAKK